MGPSSAPLTPIAMKAMEKKGGWQVWSLCPPRTTSQHCSDMSVGSRRGSRPGPLSSSCTALRQWLSLCVPQCPNPLRWGHGSSPLVTTQLQGEACAWARGSYWGDELSRDRLRPGHIPGHHAPEPSQLMHRSNPLAEEKQDLKMDSSHVRAHGSAGLGPGSRPAVAPLSSRFPGPRPAVPPFHPVMGLHQIP